MPPFGGKVNKNAGNHQTFPKLFEDEGVKKATKGHNAMGGFVPEDA